MSAHNRKDRQLVFTVKDRCRVCYTCVRECPVKAIRISNGQAEVISERCIGCGNCIKVCSQDAKQFLDTRKDIRDILKREETSVAMIAPSFPAEFKELKDPGQIVNMLRNLGFEKVVEVSFGADMVAKEYAKILEENEGKHYISSDCPAIVNYISYYYPELVDNLAPIASPMVATARIVRELYGEDASVVFIGPCVAKKAESMEVDEGLTFSELRLMLEEDDLYDLKTEPGEFDEPRSGKGAIFPVSRGLLQTAGKKDDICDGNILVAEGKENFKEAINEFESGLIKSQHLELLCCDGCIMGPGMSNGGKKFERTIRISNYVNDKLSHLDTEKWKENVHRCSCLDYSQSFEKEDKRGHQVGEEQIRKVLVRMGKEAPSDHLNCGACGYPTCFAHAKAIVEGLAENEMCLPYTIEKLHNLIEDLNESNEKLASTQQALKHSEKLASMGQLSAGIAHELNNPLGVITMYSNILKDETPEDSPLYQDLDLIVEQTARCKNIVGGLLNFARKNQVRYTEVNLAEFIQKSTDSIITNGKVRVAFNNKAQDPVAMIDPEQMIQVLTNLEKNAVEAMPDGGELTLILDVKNDDMVISVSDTGGGIKPEHMDKLFTPFFTTKEVGKGTGLGLPLVYGIVKMHKGKINVQSNHDPAKGPTGTTFVIEIPRKTLLKS
jgi:iron only hydrogenase large subunit-like protein/nitrogen-specific signal transduction histidine kinase